MGIAQVSTAIGTGTPPIYIVLNKLWFAIFGTAVVSVHPANGEVHVVVRDDVDLVLLEESLHGAKKSRHA